MQNSTSMSRRSFVGAAGAAAAAGVAALAGANPQVAHAA